MGERGIILTEGLVLGLFFVQRYRFLTINQFARAAGMQRDNASRQLREMERRGVLVPLRQRLSAWPRAHPESILSDPPRLGAPGAGERYPP